MSKDQHRWQRDQLLRDDRFRYGRSEEEEHGADARHSPDAGYDAAGATYGGGYGGYYRGPYEGRDPRAMDRRSLRGFGGDEDQYGRGYYTYEHDGDRGDQHHRRGLFARIEDKFASLMGKGPQGYGRSAARIEEEICERLNDHPHVDASDVEVVVREAEVSLIGTVSNRRTKRLIEAVVDGVSGVKDVHNQLRIRSKGAANNEAADTASPPFTSTPTIH